MAPLTKTYRWRKNKHVVSNTLKTNLKLIIKTNKTKTFSNYVCLIVNIHIINKKKIFLNQLYNLSTTATLFNPLKRNYAFSIKHCDNKQKCSARNFTQPFLWSCQNPIEISEQFVL